MRYVVGYTPNRSGADSIRLAVSLLRERSAALDVVVVIPKESRTFSAHSAPDPVYDSHLGRHGEEWLKQGLALVPEGLPVSGRVVRSESIPEGLMMAAAASQDVEEAGLIVVGASHRGARGRITIGSSASVLLHSSSVPVALAPSGYDGEGPITRVTCATGMRQGAEALVEVAAVAAAARGIPLRLMSLLALDDEVPQLSRRARYEQYEEHARALATGAQDSHPAVLEIDSVVGQGRSVEDCVGQLEFVCNEIVVVGSSRLAGPRRLFIGSSAMRMLRALPVPMIVVPRDYQLRTPQQ